MVYLGMVTYLWIKSDWLDTEVSSYTTELDSPLATIILLVELKEGTGRYRNSCADGDFSTSANCLRSDLHEYRAEPLRPASNR